MTETTSTDAPVRDRTVIVTVPPESRLETLLCVVGVQDEKYQAAKKALDETKAGILKELTALYPDQDVKSYDIPPGPMWKGYSYSYSEAFYLPAKKIREHLLPVFEAFKEVKSSWRFTRKGE